MKLHPFHTSKCAQTFTEDDFKWVVFLQDLLTCHSIHTVQIVNIQISAKRRSQTAHTFVIEGWYGQIPNWPYFLGLVLRLRHLRFSDSSWDPELERKHRRSIWEKGESLMLEELLSCVEITVSRWSHKSQVVLQSRVAHETTELLEVQKTILVTIKRLHHRMRKLQMVPSIQPWSSASSHLLHWLCYQTLGWFALH